MNGRRILSHKTKGGNTMLISEMDNKHLSNTFNMQVRLYLINRRSVYKKDVLTHPRNSEHVLRCASQGIDNHMQNPYFRNLVFRLSGYLKQI